MTRIGYLATRPHGPTGSPDDQERKGIQAWKWLNEMPYYPANPPRALSQGRAEAWQRREERGGKGRGGGRTYMFLRPPFLQPQAQISISSITLKLRNCALGRACAWHGYV